MRKVVVGIILVVGIVSCDNSKESVIDTTIQPQKGEVVSKLSANSKTASEIKAAAEKREKEREAQEKERLAKQTTMEISPLVYDFGQIPKEKPVVTYFTIKNTGDKPLIINESKASCGCTVPQKLEEPILPGEEHELKVTFTSNPGQEGHSINKTVTVSANIPEFSKTVTITGQVAD